MNDAGGVGVILLYHRIIAPPTVDPWDMCVPPVVFRKQMETLRRDFRPMSLRALEAARAAGSIPERAVAVTFDDGYLDNLSVASPLLTELEIPATFFVTTSPLNAPHVFWWDELQAATSDWSALMARHAVLLKCTPEARNEWLESWLGPRRLTLSGDSRPLVTREVQQLASRPQHSIGAHTVNHLSLPEIPEAQARSELASCKAELERCIGCCVNSLAYPFGRMDLRIRRFAEDSGFDIGVMASSGCVRPTTDPLALPRIPVTARTDLRAVLERMMDLA